jgi:hypothetical protein
MTELDLHNQWINKDVSLFDLKLADGRGISIVHFGHYNSNLAGPDFSMGIISIDGIEFVGPIEMHLKSSDWYQHNHHLDTNYDNVILHVVYEHDADIFQNGHLIPTLQLNARIQKYIPDEIPVCSKQVHHHVGGLERMKHEAISNRLLNKKAEIIALSDYHPRERLYKLLAISFGSIINREQFLELCQRIPVTRLVGLREEEIYTLIMETSNIQTPRKEWEAGKDIFWHFKGLRPASFPTVRVEQFAKVCSELLFKDEFSAASVNGDIDRLRSMLTNVSSKIKMSQGYIDHLLINSFIPYSFSVNTNSDQKLLDLPILQLKGIRAESNGKIKMWRDIGVSVENAYDSQSLLEVYRNFCCRKKCLSCEVGKELLTDH